MPSIDLRTACAVLLIVGSTFDLISNLLFTGRSILKWFAETAVYLRWERGLLVAAFVLAAMGVTLFEMLLNQAGDTVLSRMGATAFLIGASAAVISEAAFLSRGAFAQDALEVIMVSVLFGAEAILGAAILTTSLLPTWVGWVVAAWNIGLLIILTVFSPGNMYYPAAHFLPLMWIGVGLLISH